jgi:preprotein translocase subunit SecA
VLNAKLHQKEADIVAEAGNKSAVTIATNMAGRGTDIMLGGNPNFLTQSLLKNYFNNQLTGVDQEELDYFSNITSELDTKERRLYYNDLINRPLAELESENDSKILEFVDLYKKILTTKNENVKNEGKFIRDLGGLHVIGTERHESRRIDNQLRGRSGRQGDPGSSRFFLSLEDKLLRIFGGDQILGIMENIGFQDDTPIESSLLNRSLESAQKKVEAYYFDTRKQLFEYDQALNIQRNCVYIERKRILQQSNLRDWVLDYADRSLYDLLICLRQSKDTVGSVLNLLKPQYLLIVANKLTNHINFDQHNRVPNPVNYFVVKSAFSRYIHNFVVCSMPGHTQKVAFEYQNNKLPPFSAQILNFDLTMKIQLVYHLENQYFA